MMIYIVIPIHDRKEFTRKCLLSLQDQTISGHKVIVVDDGSSDGSGEMIRTGFPDVTIIPGDGNLFWTAAVNMGIREALSQGADYVMTLNNDTVATPDFMEHMLLWSAEKPDALLGALDIDYSTRKPYYGGEIIDPIWQTTTFLLEELDKDDMNGLHPVSLFPGRGLLIPRKVFDVIGLFDEKQFPHYMADYDFTSMARAHGFEIFCNYDAKLYTFPEEGGDHKIRRSKSLKNYYKHLFDIKGGGNLRNFTRYTLRYSPAPLVPLHLIKGYTQRLVGFFLH